jgi:ketosteroid isomerase-like protein
MILSKFFMVVFLGAFLVAPGSHADDIDLEKAVRSLIDAEIAYDKLANETSFAAASVHVFADDGVAFAPGIVNGKRFWSKETEPPILTWRPIFATISRSGDLGYTTGPWELRKTKGDPNPAAFGHYNTIWRKDPDGVWKVVVDGGVDHSPPAEPAGKVETFVPASAIARPETVGRRLEEAEKAFAELLAKDAGAAVLAKASDQIRVYRAKAVPAVGKTAAQLMLGSDHGKETRTRTGGGVSRAQDLAYSYGDYSSEDANAKERGTYFSIWQLDPSSEWRLVLDQQKKAPPEKK